MSLQVVHGLSSQQIAMPAGCVEIAQAFWGMPSIRPTRMDVPHLGLCHPQATLPAVSQRVFAPVGAMPLSLDGRAVGYMYEDEDAQYALLTGILPTHLDVSRGEQASSAFQNIERALAPAGMDFHNVVRTWLYMDDVLSWYGELNAARDAFFESRDVFNRFVPASTGIGSANISGSAIAVCAYAVNPKTSRVSVQVVDSPLQCSALNYRSSFSRAAEVATPAGRTLFISGTASIEPNSHDVAYVGDIDKQVDCTMRAVTAILESRKMSYADVSRAVVYLKEPAFLASWQRWLHENHLPSFAECIVADVCRDEWLFEIELDAKVVL